MSVDYQSSPLWLRTLGDQGPDDPHHDAREMLRASYLQLRQAVEPLAAEIAISMPSFTVHSVSHSDALWQMASTLTSADFPLNPAEAYVLGGTFLLHDLGMGLSAFERGEAELREDPLFKDLISQSLSRYKLRAGADPSEQELQELEGEALVAVLRRRHAPQAEKLVARTFKTSFNDEYFLIEKTDLRHAWGPLIGRIAHSHWFDVGELNGHFGQVKGSLSGYPVEWDVDPLKIACALRLADACHVDADRAPTYLTAVRAAEGISADHWYFQERLNQPRLEQDRLVYTSNVDFDADHAREWWLAYETASFIDRELRRVDALCQDLDRPRFVARAVAGTDAPERFRNYVGVQGWTPIDARLKVSSVEDLAASMGGKSLYGNRPEVALRELVANAADAVRARITQFNVSSDATIHISLDEHTDGSWWLTVEDRGIGMDPERMLSSLTDFGRSGWTSADVLDNYPGLVSRGYKPIGRFGIGFYSVFMIADHVEIRSLKYRAASSDTCVLVFEKGLSGRPLLRHARENEEILAGGTIVRLKLKHPPLSKEGFLRSESVDGSVSEMFRTEIKAMCALLEFDVLFRGPGEPDFQIVVNGGGWKVASTHELFETAYADRLRPSNGSALAWATLSTRFVDGAQDLLDVSGDIIGRASLDLSSGSDGLPWWTSPYAKVYVGGLFADTIFGLLGVFVGEPLRADRMNAFPSASKEELLRWATEQAVSQAPKAGPVDSWTRRAASVARGLGARLEDQPIAYSSGGFLTPVELANWIAERESVIMIPEWELQPYPHNGRLRLIERERGDEIELPNDALYLAFVESWIFPDEVQEYPRDDRFSDFGVLKTDVFNPAYWWHIHGALGGPNTVLEAALDKWQVTVDDIASHTTSHELIHLVDGRLSIATADGSDALVDAIEIRRPRSSTSSDSGEEVGPEGLEPPASSV